MIRSGYRLASSIFAIFTIFLVLSSPQAAQAEKRVALVIGNGAYKNAVLLPNPGNDAGTSPPRSGAPTSMSFSDSISIGREWTNGARFARAARDADVALFYYSGHAMQFAGVNYLMPVDAKLTDEADLRRLTKVDDIVADLQQAKNLRILVLDSCRDNPLAEELKRSIGRSRAVTVSRGLAKLDSPQGMIVAYSTQSGRTADDGTGRNSPYTAAFLRHIEAPEEIGTVFRRVSSDVYEATQRSQLPELSLSLIGEFYLKGRPQGTTSVPTPAPPTTKDGAAGVAWVMSKDTTSVAVLEAFIRQYDDTIYGPLARARLEEVKSMQAAAAKPPQPTSPSTATPNAPPVAVAKVQPTGPTDTAPKPPAQKLARPDVVKLFAPFASVLEKARSDYVEQPDEKKILASAVDGLRTAFPSPQNVSSAGRGPANAASSGNTKADINAVYDVALEILNRPNENRDSGRVVASAIKGLLAGLDPHSSYLDAQQYRNMQQQTRGEFGGLGVEVNMKDGLVRVVTPYDDSPAAKAGVLSGDTITHLDDAPVQGLTLNEAVNKMRGAVGTAVKLTIIREGQERPIDISVTREIVRVRAVRWRVEADDIGYIRLNYLNQQATENLKKAVGEIISQVGAGKLRGYVVDLRNSPGGLFDQVIAVSDELLDKGDIASTRGRTAEHTRRYSAKAGDVTGGKPMAVLINGGTASGAEIIAGALQDNKRATIIGTRSFGNGSVQTIIPLGADAGAVRLTTER